jgi:peptidoglycan/LPS O-acetylase OafA/YrhL
MTSTKREASDIKSAHGVRFLNMIVLILSHRCMTIFFHAYSNKTEMTEALTANWTAIARACVLCTDTFFLLSGMLTAYSFQGRLMRKQNLNVLQEYAGRYIRILPPLMTIAIFNTYVLPLLGNGPQWNSLIGYQVDLCKNNWWRNLFFIQNFYGFENICVTHSHYVCVDSQLFIVAPLLIYTIYKWPKNGSLFVAAIAVLSTLARFYVSYSNVFTDYFYYGIRFEFTSF